MPEFHWQPLLQQELGSLPPVLSELPPIEPPGYSKGRCSRLRVPAARLVSLLVCVRVLAGLLGLQIQGSRSMNKHRVKVCLVGVVVLPVNTDSGAVPQMLEGVSAGSAIISGWKREVSLGALSSNGILAEVRVVEV